MKKPTIRIADWQNKPYYNEFKWVGQVVIEASLPQSFKGLDAVIVHTTPFEYRSLLHFAERASRERFPVVFEGAAISLIRDYFEGKQLDHSTLYFCGSYQLVQESVETIIGNLQK